MPQRAGPATQGEVCLADTLGAMAQRQNHISDWILGTDPKQRLRTANTMLALGVYAAFAAVQQGEVYLGLIDSRDSWILTLWNLTGAVGFVMIVRSGLNLK